MNFFAFILAMDMIKLTVYFFIIVSNVNFYVKSDTTILYDVFCEDAFMIASWKMPSYTENVAYSNLSASFLDVNCNSTDGSRTNMIEDGGYYQLNMTTNYDDCGTTISNTSDYLFVNNTAILRVTDVLRGGITQRDYYYQYDMSCQLKRNISVDTGNSSYEVDTNTVNITGEYNKTTNLDFKVSMNLYTDNTFTTEHPVGSLTVNVNEMLYIKIKEDANSTDFKFVVDKCEAVPSLTTSSSNDVFFKDGCRLDPTFERMGNDGDNDTFSFQFQAFYYGNMSAGSNIYLRCYLYVCRTSSQISQCQQTCKSTGNRQRRDITNINFDGNQIEEITVTSQKIVFNKLTCSDVVCPSNSKCYPLEQARCICGTGYVYSRTENKCTEERITQINNIHLEKEWNPSYLNITSPEFLALAVYYEDILYKSFQAADKTNVIEGVRVIGAKEGSVILETRIVYAPSSSPNQALEAFVESVQSKSLQATTVRKELNLLTDRTPAIVEIERKMADLQKLTMIIIIVVLLLVILISVLVIVSIRNRQRVTTKNADIPTFDNAGIVMAQFN